MQIFGMPGDHNLEHHGLTNLKAVYWNLTPAALVEQVILRQEAMVAKSGAVVVNTGKHTGRSPGDKYIVRRNHPDDQEIAWGKINQPISIEQFRQLFLKIRAYLQGKEIYVQDMQAGAHPRYQVPIRIISEKAWAALFTHDLFIRLPAEKIAHHNPSFTVFHCPGFIASPDEDHTNSGTIIAIDFTQKVILIAGTSYAGEIKKSVFTAMNYLLPRQNVLSMHCSANIGSGQDVSLFFGLSGTGKTTLSSDINRRLIGDDEHGWASDGVFNIEGGCYAKAIHLRQDLEPLIWDASHRFGAVLENVTCDSNSRELDFDDDHRTENTRVAYPIDYIPNHIADGRGGHPRNIFFLTADAFGVIPPISRLSPAQAMYYFLSGYTSKLAGTETGLGAEPLATFSTCFGAPFLPLAPQVYARLLGEKIALSQANVWLVNTGWTGGPYGIGQRIRRAFPRAMIEAVHSGAFDTMPEFMEPYFGLSIPQHCPGVPDQVLRPEYTWTDSNAYDRQVNTLIGRFDKNFDQFRQGLPPEVAAAGPRLAVLSNGRLS
jgi:phosphoenolpyruvate carboxykinase (ATP)